VRGSLERRRRGGAQFLGSLTAQYRCLPLQRGELVITAHDVSPRECQLGGNTLSARHVADKVCVCDPAASVEWVVPASDENPWRPDAEGHLWFTGMSKRRPATVAEVNALGGTKNYPAEGHLRWLYTWGDYIKINGKFYRET
jgi:hypothetical protein